MNNKRIFLRQLLLIGSFEKDYKSIGFNGFSMSLLVLHLTEAKVLNIKMSSYQIFKLTLNFIGLFLLYFFICLI
jgi:hypothetical protein